MKSAVCRSAIWAPPARVVPKRARSTRSPSGWSAIRRRRPPPHTGPWRKTARPDRASTMTPACAAADASRRAPPPRFWRQRRSTTMRCWKRARGREPRRRSGRRVLRWKRPRVREIRSGRAMRKPRSRLRKPQSLPLALDSRASAPCARVASMPSARSPFPVWRGWTRRSSCTWRARARSASRC